MSAWRFTIDPEVRRAIGPPAAFYTDPAAYEAQRERLFRPSWQWVPSEAMAVGEGEARSLRLLPGCLDEPLVVTRERGERRCLSNVCTHRAHAVVTHETPLKHPSGLRCPYHGRRFGLDGSFRSMPSFEGVEDFPSPDDDLARVSLEALGPITFASRSPRVSFARWTSAITDRVPASWLASLVEDPSSAKAFPLDAHWALYCENYLEGLHIPFLHPGLNAVIDMRDYRYELLDAGVLQIGVARPGEAAFDPPHGHPEHNTRVAAWYFWLMPHTMVNVYPWGISLNVVTPIAHDRTEIRYRSFVADASLRASGAGGALDTVEMEDQSAVRSVQQNLRAEGYRRARYSPVHERGTHHFHRLAADWLG